VVERKEDRIQGSGRKKGRKNTGRRYKEVLLPTTMQQGTKCMMMSLVRFFAIGNLLLMGVSGNLCREILGNSSQQQQKTQGSSSWQQQQCQGQASSQQQHSHSSSSQQDQPSTPLLRRDTIRRETKKKTDTGPEKTNVAPEKTLTNLLKAFSLSLKQTGSLKQTAGQCHPNLRRNIKSMLSEDTSSSENKKKKLVLHHLLKAVLHNLGLSTVLPGQSTQKTTRKFLLSKGNNSTTDAKTLNLLKREKILLKNFRNILTLLLKNFRRNLDTIRTKNSDVALTRATDVDRSMARPKQEKDNVRNAQTPSTFMQMPTNHGSDTNMTTQITEQLGTNNFLSTFRNESAFDNFNLETLSTAIAGADYDHNYYHSTTPTRTTGREMLEIIDTDKPWGILVVDILCIATPIMLFLAPASLFWPIVKAWYKYGKKSPKSRVVMPPLHFSAMYLQCHVYALFGFGIKEPVIYMHVVPGAILAAIWLTLYGMFYAEEDTALPEEGSSKTMGGSSNANIGSQTNANIGSSSANIGSQTSPEVTASRLGKLTRNKTVASFLGALATKKSDRSKGFIERRFCAPTFRGQFRTQVLFLIAVCVTLTTFYILFDNDVIPSSGNPNKVPSFDTYVEACGWMGMVFAIPFLAHTLVVLTRVYNDKRFNRSPLMGSLAINLVALVCNISWLVNCFAFLPNAVQIIPPNMLGLIGNSASLYVRWIKRKLPMPDSGPEEPEKIEYSRRRSVTVVPVESTAAVVPPEKNAIHS